MGWNHRVRAIIIARFGEQQRFARRLGVSSSLVSHVLAGRVGLSEERKRQWADVLGVPVSFLDEEKVPQRLGFLGCKDPACPDTPKMVGSNKAEVRGTGGEQRDECGLAGGTAFENGL